MRMFKELARKFGAAKGRAGARAEEAKDCAMERVSDARYRLDSAGFEAKMNFQMARSKVEAWWAEKAKARARRAKTREDNKMIFKMESMLAEKEYEVSLKEYQQYRKEEAHVKYRNIFKRMQKLNMIDPNMPPPPRLRRSYPKKPVVLLPPKKPLKKSYADFLKSTDQYVSLLNRTVQTMLVRPATSVGAALVILAVGIEAHEELKSPGTFKTHISKLAKIVKVPGSNGGEDAEDVADEEAKAT